MHNPTSPTQRVLPLSVVLGWASGSLAMSIMYQATNVLLLRYLVDFLGVSASIAGTMIGASKLFDAVADPMIGIASDKTRSRWGRRRPWLFAGGILCSSAFFAVFAMPVIADTTIRYLAIEAVLLVLAAGYGVFNIPYIAMPAEMDVSGAERTRLISFRIAAVALGGIAAVFLGPIVIETFGGGRLGHRAMAIMISLVILASAFACFWFTSKAPVRMTVPDPVGRTLKEQFRLALENRPFFVLILVKLLSLFGGGMMGAAQPFLYLYLLKSDYKTMGFAFLISSVSMILAQPLWVAISHRFGNKRMYLMIAPVAACVTLSWMLAAPGERFALIALRSVLGGIAMGGTLLAQQAMLPETIAYDYTRTGMRREGVFSGVYTTIEKVSAAVAAGAVGGLLASFGYIASTTGGVVQGDGVLTAVRLCYLISAGCSIASALVAIAYRIEVNDD